MGRASGTPKPTSKFFRWGHLTHWLRGERDRFSPADVDLTKLLKDPERPCLIYVRPDFRRNTFAARRARMLPNISHTYPAVMNMGHIFGRRAAYLFDERSGQAGDGVWYRINNSDPSDLAVRRVEKVTTEYTLKEMYKVDIEQRFEFYGTFNSLLRNLEAAGFVVFDGAFLVDLDGFLFYERAYIDAYNTRQGTQIDFMHEVDDWSVMRQVFNDNEVVMSLEPRPGAREFLQALKQRKIERVPGTSRPSVLSTATAWQLREHGLEMDRPVTFITGGMEGKAQFAWENECRWAGDDHAWNADAIARATEDFGGKAFYLPDPSQNVYEVGTAIRVASYEEILEVIDRDLK